ncbi:MAG TPA: hypothetical protein VGH56_04525 [Solirubrobacteraceae bacterium]
MDVTPRELRWMLFRLLPLLALLLAVAIVTAPARSTADEGPLIAAAHRLLHGHYADTTSMDGTKFLWHGPGLPALIAPLVALGVPLQGLRLTSPLLLFAAVVLFYRMLRPRLSPRGALLGAYALGLYFPGYYVLGTVAKDPLALLLSIVTLDASARYMKWGRRRHAAIAGLALAALAMTRLEYGWVIALALGGGVAWWLTARLRHAPAGAQTAGRWTLICAVAMVGCLPWLAYTYSLTGHPFYWGNSGGLSLYWMSSPSLSQLGQWHSPHMVLSDPRLTGYRPFFHYLATLRPVPRDLKLEHVAVAQVLAHPGKFGLNVLANLGRMFAGFPFSFVLPTTAIVGLIAINGTLFAGLLAAARRLGRAGVRLPRESGPFFLFAALGLLVHVLPTAEPRLAIPLIPVPVWLIAHAWGARVGSEAPRPARYRTAQPRTWGLV